MKSIPILLSLTLLLAACDVRAQDDEAPGGQATTTESAQLSRSVRTVRAEMGALTVTRSASATVNPSQESQVSAAATGQIEAVLVDSGARVEAGQAVIQLDDDALRLQLTNADLALQTARINLQKGESSSGSNNAQSEAALQAAQSGQEIAQRQLGEGQKLLNAGGISQTEFAQLEVASQQANAALIQAQAAATSSLRAPEEDLQLLSLQVQQAQTQVAQAQQGLADAQITAPYAGEVADVLVNAGEFIGAGTPAFRLVGTGAQQATFSVAPEDASALQTQGQIWLPYNGRDYAAQVKGVSQVADTRLVEVTADIYPAETTIPSGTVTQFDYELELARGVLVPSSALRESNAQTNILVIRDGRAVSQNVTVKAEGGAQVAVEGLESGAQIVYPRPADLTPGTPVEIVRGGGA